MFVRNFSDLEAKIQAELIRGKSHARAPNWHVSEERFREIYT
jgi:hypothetical protein